MLLNKDAVGKTYPRQVFPITEEAAQAYARAYNENNPWFFDKSRKEGIVIPPMYGVAYSWSAMTQAISDETLGVTPEALLRVVHGEQDMRFHEWVRPGDQVEVEGFIQGIEEKSSGEILVVGSRSFRNGKLVQETFSPLFFRAPKKDKKSGSETSPVEEPKKPRILTKEQKIDEDQTQRYAEASGDQNPIHLYDEVAQMAGLPMRIVHGLCTMAFTSKVIIDHLCDGDPRRLKRLSVRFSKPVFPGQTIRTEIWKEGEKEGRKVYGYETYNPEGIPVIKNGIAEMTPL